MKFLFAIWEGGGNTPPQLGVARGLAERGHDVRVLADPVLVSDVEAAGCEFVTWTEAPHRSSRGPEADFVRHWEARTPVGAFARVRDSILTGPALRYARDVSAELHRRPADAVAPDYMLLGAQIGASGSGVPVAALVHTVWPLPVRGRPPFGSGLKPSRTALGRGLHALVDRAGMAVFNRGLPALNQARSEFGLAPLEAVVDQVVDVDRVLVLSSAAFDFPLRDLPPNVRVVGPQLDDPAWAEPWTPPPGDAPLVLVAMSSYSIDQAGAMARIVQALGTLPVRGVVTLGPALDAVDLPKADNVTVVRSAPHRAVLEHAAAVVTHGGHGTVMKALAAAVPVVCMPMGSDQADNVARLTWHGAGRRVRTGASSKRIAGALRAVLEDPGYAAAAGRIGAAIAAETSGNAAVEELEALAAGRRTASAHA